MKEFRILFILPVLMAVGVLALATNAQAAPPSNPPNDAPARGNGPVIYVTTQDLVYDSIVLADLPFQGRFQKLEALGPTGLQTAYGLGDQQYLGGRWWMDDGDNVMEDPSVSGDVYFLCPLLGPGREPPM